MSICTVTRYTSALAQFRQRIFQPHLANVNWLHGHWSGYSGVAFYSGWLTTGLSTTATKWVSTCSSYDTGSGVYTLDVNGRPYTSALAGMMMPDALSINGNVYVDAEWSAFGVAEFLTWNRALTDTELNEVQNYLTSKYGLVDAQPPAPPVPAAPQQQVAALASGLSNGLMTWYDMDGYSASTQTTGVWTSQLNSNSVAITGVDVMTDAPGTAGNSVAITYVSGPSTTKIIFPEAYSALTAMSICTITRYTSPLSQYRARIFQPFKADVNWLHGHWCVHPRPPRPARCPPAVYACLGRQQCCAPRTYRARTRDAS
jgi:hypothetical protein